MGVDPTTEAGEAGCPTEPDRGVLTTVLGGITIPPPFDLGFLSTIVLIFGCSIGWLGGVTVSGGGFFLEP